LRVEAREAVSGFFDYALCASLRMTVLNGDAGKNTGVLRLRLRMTAVEVRKNL